MGRLSSLIRRWHRRWRIGALVDAADQVPQSIPARQAILVGAAIEPKWLVLDCPCGHPHRLMLNLDLRRRPSWTVMRESPLSLWPSVDARTAARRCHFVIREGRIDWVTNPAPRR
jgi:hypothetical protein